MKISSRLTTGSLVIGLTAVCVTNAIAASLDDLMPGEQKFEVAVKVACGNKDKSNCAQVLPRVAEYSRPRGVTLEAIESKGSAQSANGVCLGAVQFAIGQLDAFDAVQRNTDCTGTYESVGKPLYPYQGYFVVASNNKASTLDALVANVTEGKALSVASGKIGSGGQVTFENILKANPSYKRVVRVVDSDQDTSLERITNGTLDGYFVMDGPGSDLVQSIKNSKDKNGEPLYKFLDVHPGDAFYGLKSWGGMPMYNEVTIAKGWLMGRDTKTVSTNAVMIVNTKWMNQSRDTAKAVKIITDSADKAEGAIRSDTLTPETWAATRSR
jgi:TRAP-type uncharacterized transport system substrate-binding protein